MCEEHERVQKRFDEIEAEMKRLRVDMGIEAFWADDSAEAFSALLKRVGSEEFDRGRKRFKEIIAVMQRVHKFVDEWSRSGRRPTQEDIARYHGTVLAILDGVQT